MKKILNFLLILFICIQYSFALQLKAKQAILIDYETNEILFQKNSNERVYPSSMTKIMTAYIVFEKLKNNKLSLDDKFLISEDAWKQLGSRMFLNVGTKVSIDELLYGLIVQSGNDAAYALAEGILGNVQDFVKLMNEKAVQMDLKDTHFENPIGFNSEEHFMSVKDTAIISKFLIKDFPEYYAKYFSTLEYKYNKIVQKNRNELLDKYNGVDGIKTGHTELGGFAIAVSAIRDGRRLISVVNGLETNQDRMMESRKLLDYGFLTLKKNVFFKKDEVIKNIPILYGKEKTINIISKKDVSAYIQPNEEVGMSFIIDNNLKAPITTDEKVGILILTTEADEIIFDLYPEKNVKQANFLKRMFLFCKYLLVKIK